MTQDIEWEPLTDKAIEEVESNIWKEARQASKVGIFDTKINFKIFIAAKLTLRKLLQTVFRNMDSINPKYEIVSTDQVTFAMVHDNITQEISRLDGIRAKRTKFICLNDDMKNPSKELLQGIDDFFSNLFPFPSRFELPNGKRNDFSFLDRSKYRPNDLANVLKKEEEEKNRKEKLKLELEKANGITSFIPGSVYTSESYAWWFIVEVILIIFAWIAWQNKRKIIYFIQNVYLNNGSIQDIFQASRRGFEVREQTATTV